ncbi:MAG: glutamine--fructose-6-phosphate transaminase (isomerizing), partial [Candidatus Altiarchaeota archaeon]|nr:glutamine--fructose-6-phosphate transaminase (isomerizing) [Candidatus Altiarchaeota archaeon]
MCGIIGYVGEQDVSKILQSGLKRLEYRGYDSTGLAVMSPQLVVEKTVGTIDQLENGVSGKIGIGHTRWATHGGVSQRNAHPHIDCVGNIAVVHNGIIENYLELRKELKQTGHVFRSETDTEVIAHLIEENMDLGIEQAFLAAIDRLSGSYAISAVVEGMSGILVARNKSPLVLGFDRTGVYAASDVFAFIDQTNSVAFLNDGEAALLQAGGAKMLRGELRQEKISWNPGIVDKNGFPHFMLKEIHDQPAAIKNTLMDKGVAGFSEKLAELDHLNITAAGTSYHAALAFKYAAELPVELQLASEFPSLYKHGPLLAISQSGETADTLEAVRHAAKLGAPIYGLVNIPGSSLTRLADFSFNTCAGQEIGVAATKTFTSQLAALYGSLGLLDSSIEKRVKQSLKLENDMRKLAVKLKDHKNIFYIGRGSSVVTAMEAALKLKEISYIHAEAFPAGELKHGTLALIENSTPVIA